MSQIKKLGSFSTLTTFAVLGAVGLLGVAPGSLWAGDDDRDKEYRKCSAEASACIREMSAGLSERGWIGIEWDDDTEHPVLTQVVSNSPAEAAGLRKGDRLTAFNDVPTDAGEEAVWAEAKKSLIPGKTITLTIVREGATKKVDVKLVPIPRHVMAQWIGNHVLDHHAAESEEPEEPEEAEAPKP